MPFGEDKRFKTYFVRAKDLGKMFWDEIDGIDRWQQAF